MRLVNLANYPQFTAINALSDPGHIAGPVVVPSCMRVIIGWTTASGKGAKNILTARYTGTFPGTQTMANTIMTGLTTGGPWTANLQGDLATTTALASVALLDINTPNNTPVTSNLAAVPGTAAGTEMPDEAAIVVTLRTPKTGPQNRGRMYLVGFTSAAVGAGNIINAPVVTHVQTWAGNIFNVLTSSGLSWQIAQPARAAYTSPTTGREFPARSATSITVTTVLVRDNHWDSQRRRGLK